MRFDAVASAPASRLNYSDKPSSGRRKDGLSPEVIKQLSGGSLSGFLTGLLVSVFSKTLVLLIGIGIVSIQVILYHYSKPRRHLLITADFSQVASHYGLDLVKYLKLKNRVESSKILTGLRYNPAFKIAFGVTFALSAFMSF